MMCVPRMFYIHFTAFITHVFIVTVCVCFYCCWHCWWLRECAARRRCWLMKFYCHHASAGLRCVVSWCHAFLRMSLFLANRTKPNSFENISVRIFSTDSNSKTVWNLCPGILLLVPISMNVILKKCQSNAICISFCSTWIWIEERNTFAALRSHFMSRFNVIKLYNPIINRYLNLTVGTVFNARELCYFFTSSVYFR